VLFVPYVTAGYPTRAHTVPLLLAMEAAGAGVIELGVPFSDPLADGATIQHANQVGVEQGVTLAECIAMVAEARSRGLKAPVLLMGYYNPILALGEERTASEAAAAGIDGFIVVDLPPEEAVSFLAFCRRHDLSFVPLVAPTTRDERLPLLAGAADAFLYCVSVTGTTGARTELPADLGAFIARVRRKTDLPLAVGFGVSRREHVEAVAKLAEAAVVGSAIIATLDRAAPGQEVAAVEAFVRDVATGHSSAWA